MIHTKFIDLAVYLVIQGGSFAGLVYDPDGIAPTVNTAQGGLRMPLIIEVRNDRDKRRNNKDKGSNI